MTPEEAAQLLYEKWLVLAISPEVKRAIRTLCAALDLPDPAPNRPQRVISSKPESTHPWGDPEVLAGNDYR